MARVIVSAMTKPLIDIVAMPDRAGVSRWQAVVACGAVAGVAGVTPLPASPLVRPGGAELSLAVEPEWRRRGIGSRLAPARLRHPAPPRSPARRVPGPGAAAFQTTREQWERAVQPLLESLQQMGLVLNQASSAYETNESSIARAFARTERGTQSIERSSSMMAPLMREIA